MEDLERLVEGRLRALDGTDPSEEVRARVLGRVNRQVAVRRRRRRVAGTVAGASLVVAGGFGVPALLPALEDGAFNGTAPVAIGSADPDDDPLLGGYDDPEESGSPGVGGATDGDETTPGAAGGLGRNLPTGKTLSVFGIGADGTVLGTGVGPKGRSDGTLWRADLDSLLGAPVPLAEPKGLYAAAGSADLSVWPERTRDGFQLMCQDTAGTPVQLGAAGVARRASLGFHVDQGHVVWTDRTGARVWSAKGCAGKPTELTDGYAAGLAYPYVYVLGDDTTDLHRVHLETGESEDRSLPPVSKNALFAAAENTFSVADDRKLTVYDADTWQPHTVPDRLPQGKATLSAGDTTVAYTTGDESLLYDTTSNTATTHDGTAYANGPYVLTREGDAFTLQRK
ncbi:hypothetical protein LO762_16135 [Actinocorallia sp. API 0066]|uniref:hypothetical protein n=1 Tax=Actinocorallia sp. API 0066 TaxID=2896846 RepID=UPI001E4DAF58|nr:hypothetical protein [Actinocorallia sp. API 0066]MCD0450706.1 hypothetical protein [Actinocorallia sp. API 0066]